MHRRTNVQSAGRAKRPSPLPERPAKPTPARPRDNLRESRICRSLVGLLPRHVRQLSRAHKGFLQPSSLLVPSSNHVRQGLVVMSGPSAQRSVIRVVVFDLDGTLTTVSSIWQHVHEALGTWQLGARYASSFFKGELSYEEWARLDTRLWAGVSLRELERIVSSVAYMKGAKETVHHLRERAVKVGTISAGLSIFADKATRELGLDFSVANQPVVEDDRLTGEIIVKVGFYDKGVVLRGVLQQMCMDRSQCAAVGDDLPDLGLFRESGKAIAFNPRHAALERTADVVVRGDDLRLVLPYLI